MTERLEEGGGESESIPVIELSSVDLASIFGTADSASKPPSQSSSAGWRSDASGRTQYMSVSASRSPCPRSGNQPATAAVVLDQETSDFEGQTEPAVVLSISSNTSMSDGASEQSWRNSDDEPGNSVSLKKKRHSRLLAMLDSFRQARRLGQIRLHGVHPFQDSVQTHQSLGRCNHVEPMALSAISSQP